MATEIKSTKIVDRSGKLFINTGDYRLPDAESGTIFEPGQPTKATHTRWIDNQPAIVQCDEDGTPLTEQAKLADKPAK